MIRKYIFFTIAILFAIGIATQVKLKIDTTLIAIVLTFIIAMLTIFYLNSKEIIKIEDLDKKSTKQKFLLILFCVLFIFMAGMARICIFDWQSSKIAYNLIGNEVICRGTIAESPILYPKEGRSVYLLELKELIRKDGKIENISGYVRVYDDFYASLYEPGDYVEAFGTIRSFNEFKNPGKSDYKNTNKGRHIIGLMSLKKGTSVIEKTNDYYIERTCKKIKDNIEMFFSKHLKERNLPILMSLLFGGNYNNISPKEIQAFSTTGMIHILSVSGSHITLLFGFVYMFGRWLEWNEKITLTFTIIVIAVYSCISGFSAPVIRSSIMGFLAIAAIFLERDKTALNILGFTTLLMLICNPYYISDISFQLSVGASAGILMFYKPIEMKLKRIIPYQWIFESVSLAISAQLLIVPIILYNFHSFPIYFIFSNILVAPILDIVIILGLIATITMLILRPLSAGILYVTDYLLEFSLYINTFIANLPRARFLIGGMTVFESITYYALLAFIFINKKIREKRKVYMTILICIIFLLIFTTYSMLNKINEYVLVPDTGKTISLGIISKDGNILYYEDTGDKFAKKEFTSVLEYNGIEKADILILNLKKAKNIITLPELQINKIFVIGNDKQYLINQLKENKYNFEVIKDKETKDFEKFKIYINNEDCFIERKTNAIYIRHNNYFENLKNNKETLFIDCNSINKKTYKHKNDEVYITFTENAKKQNDKGYNPIEKGMIKLNYIEKWKVID